MSQPSIEEPSGTYNPAGAPKITPVDTPPAQNETDDFDRFEDLTRKLVKVPKSELDEKREKS